MLSNNLPHFCVTKVQILDTVIEDRNILDTLNRRKANWVGHILCRNCFLKHVIEGKIKGRMVAPGR